MERSKSNEILLDSKAHQALLKYQLTRTRRKTMALIIHPDNRLEVRCGLKTPVHAIDRFVHSKQAWILAKHQENEQLIRLDPGTGADYERLRSDTRQKVLSILKTYPQLTPSSVLIRRQRRRWGSCSRRGQVNINTCAGLLPPALLEYLVVHELCHLRHFNHGPGFYDMLTSFLPDARQRQQGLKRYLLV